MMWLPLNASIEEAESFVEEVDDIDAADLWYLEIDGEFGCLVRSCDLMGYMNYLRDYGHMVMVTNSSDQGIF